MAWDCGVFRDGSHPPDIHGVDVDRIKSFPTSGRFPCQAGAVWGRFARHRGANPGIHPHRHIIQILGAQLRGLLIRIPIAANTEMRP